MKTNLVLVAAALTLAGCASHPGDGVDPKAPSYNDNAAGQGTYNNNGASLPRNTSGPDNNGINDNASGNGNQMNNGTNFNTTPDSAPVIITNLPPSEPNKGLTNPPASSNSHTPSPSIPDSSDTTA